MTGTEGSFWGESATGDIGIVTGELSLCRTCESQDARGLEQLMESCCFVLWLCRTVARSRDGEMVEVTEAAPCPMGRNVVSRLLTGGNSLGPEFWMQYSLLSPGGRGERGR